MSPRDRSPVRTHHLDSHREKTTGTSWVLTIWLCCSWNKLLVCLARGELPPQLSLVSPKVFSPFCHRWSFDHLLLSPLACLVGDTSFQIKSNQITFIVTSPQHKCLGEWNSYERAPDSAKKQQTIYLWTDSAKNNKQFTYGQTVQKTTNNLPMDRQCKKTTNNLHMDRQCKKTALEHLQCSRQCKKKTTAIYIWTDSAKKTTAIYIWTVHIYRLYRRQCAKYTYIYSVRLVYYRDILNYQRHIIHRMGTSTLCTVSIHNVVYT